MFNIIKKFIALILIMGLIISMFSSCRNSNLLTESSINLNASASNESDLSDNRDYYLDEEDTNDYYDDYTNVYSLNKDDEARELNKKFLEDNKELIEEARKLPIETTDDGKTCYVLDYAGGKLNHNKYGKFKKLDFSKNKITGIISLDNMLYGFENVEEVNLTGLDTSNCISMCNALSAVNLNKVDFGNIVTKNVKYMYKLFAYDKKLTEISNFNIDVEKLEVSRGMFFMCESLKDIDLSSFYTPSLKDMEYMFYKCKEIENLNLEKLDVSNVSAMRYCFGNMNKLKNINLSNFKTTKSKSYSHMFYRCENLENIDLSNFNSESLVSTQYMFYCCFKLKNVSFASFDFTKVTDTKYMFYFCNNLTNIDLSNFRNGDNRVDCNYMFRYCENLTKLDMSNANISKFYGYYIFDGANKLVDFKCDMSGFKTVNEKQDSYNLGSGYDDADVTHSQIHNYVLNEDNIKSITNPIMYYQILELTNNNVLVHFADKKATIKNRDIMFTDNTNWIKLMTNEFIVKKKHEYMEFFNYYEEARYNHFPNFVTTDSMLHTYHLFFENLLKRVESTTLYDKVVDLSKKMAELSDKYYEMCKGTVFEEAAKINVAYFSVPIAIHEGNTNSIKDYVKDLVEREIELIESHSIQEIKPIFFDYYNASGMKVDDLHKYSDDYTQYTVRGHYDESEQLSRYFKMFMWYGRTNFTLSDLNEARNTILITLMLHNDEELLKEYYDIKSIIFYFAGESDDLSYDEIIRTIKNIYNTETFNEKLYDSNSNTLLVKYIEELSKYNKSRINSQPGLFSSNDMFISFRFIGQTYNFDSEMFSNLTYDKVEKTDKNEKRYLPDFLDVPASFGSETAVKILMDEGNGNYPKYIQNLQSNIARYSKELTDSDENVLYNAWLKALYNFITNEKKDGRFQSFMRNDEWKKKTLETFAGSYAELKHDTILYAKQYTGVAECSDGDADEFYDFEEIEIDTRGYVEPESEVYMSLYNISKKMIEVFSAKKFLEETDITFLNYFSELAYKLYVISEKELRNEKLSLDEYELIEGYGANIEHLIIDSGAYREYGSGNPQESKAIVADIATGESNGNYYAREIATGNPIRIYVLVKVLGEYKICQGAVYDFYQFEVPAENRLTDEEWRKGMEFERDYSDYWSDEEKPEMPKLDFTFQDWTNSYKTDRNIYSERINYYYIDHCGGFNKRNILTEYEGD